ncbi:hypothetical protein MVLG_04502 [Microbotryum lychnidis-dioicae p1A1 Lamole]|uniref:Nucleotide-diphospho-sugar transferase domain-containing protein n=1 Tax=Microbotryum lychnidis-dioicae (strain p1A1 Lamole / MvSl-1064) TaxID=683840 RepID=U5HBF1_USTV1|nr:hypothetical protein MVLG_04502 [Microbotryum lychnidis-dioicae p1A1 Lamole]|eukprot:KDE05061.1 hypothetical protein MVLG_04502 [Microbotryum lychnidis-dioicae p1A1 Lamole]
MHSTTTGGSPSKLPLPATTSAGGTSSSLRYSPSGFLDGGASGAVTVRRRWILLVVALLILLGFHQLRSSTTHHQTDPDRIRFISPEDIRSNKATSSSLWNFYGARPNRTPFSSSSAARVQAVAAAASSGPPKRIAPPPPFNLRAYSGPGSLTEYLEAHFPLSSTSDPQPHLWLTLADSFWSTSGAAALNEFVDRLNQDRWVEQVRSKGGVRQAKRSFRETVVLTLCLDEKCVESMEEMERYAFGGFIHNRPDKILVATWPKLAGLIEVLKHRDVFFVDSDVSFKLDPYPHMEPFMEDYDLIAQENDSWDHLNTGWFWMRKGELSSEAWNAVLQRDLIKVSRDQNNFNEILGTAELRACDPSQGPCSGRRPLKSSFIANNGLRVRVLDPDLFRAYHFENDVLSASRHSSVSFHMTCGDDAPTKVYTAKAQGFWADVPKGYYTTPSRLVTIDPLVGTKDELTQLVKIVLMVSKYTQRAFEPPAFAVFTDLQELDSIGREVKRSKRINSAFPLPHLEQNLGVRIVEPTYAKNVVKFLVGGGSTIERSGMTDYDLGWRERKAVETSLGLLEEVELDMRQITSIRHLLSTLSTEPFLSSPTIKLMNHDWPERNHWQKWTLSKALDHVVACDRLEERMSCDRICRFKEGQRGIRVEEGWEGRDVWLE